MKRSLVYAILVLVLVLTSCGQGIAPPEKTEEKVKTSEESQPVTVEEKPDIMQKGDPKADDVINVLMIGNSGCYYYVEELYGVAKAAGINMKVCNLYYSGCPMEKHWTWWKQNQSNYQFFVTDGNGRVKYENYSLRMALQCENCKRHFLPTRRKIASCAFPKQSPTQRI